MRVQRWCRNNGPRNKSFVIRVRITEINVAGSPRLTLEDDRIIHDAPSMHDMTLVTHGPT